jgi:hypothetical protein
VSAEQTLEAPPVEAPASPPRERRVQASVDPRELVWRFRWVLTAAALLVLSLLIVLWAKTRPGYDPYGWLVWGKLTIHLKLDTNGAPSWKPLPFLFTVPYALAGHYALWLWMVTSVAISLSGPLFAWRIAFKLTGADPARRYAAYVAGLFAALIMLWMQDPVGHFNYTHYILSVESDTMIVSICLIAVDLHLSGHHRAAFWIWWLGSLGRPEVWPFYGLAGIWLWRFDSSYRRWLIASLVLLAFLWFGIPGLTSKSLLTAGNIAENSPRAIQGNKVTGTISRFHELYATPVWIAAALALAWAAYRRHRRTLIVAAGAALWVLIEVAFALHGFPAVPRYMFEAGAIVAVLAGVFVGQLVLSLPTLLSTVAERLGAARLGTRLATQIGTWGTLAAVLVVAGSMLPSAHRQYRLERSDLKIQRARTVQLDRLSAVVRILGTSNMFACGQPNIPIAFQSVFAWYTGVKVGELYVSQTIQQLYPHPLVNIYPIRGNGWKVFPSYVDAAHAGACSRLLGGHKKFVYRG